MKVNFYIGVDSASAIDAELDTVSEVVELLDEHDLFLSRYLTIVSSGRSICTIDLHQIPWSRKDTTFKIVMRGICNAIEKDKDLLGIEIQF